MTTHDGSRDADGMAVDFVLPKEQRDERQEREAGSVNSLIERVKSAMVGLGTGWILMLMLVLSVVSLAVMLERVWLYWSLRDDIDELMRDMGRLLRAGDLDGARQRLEASRSAEAAVMVAGLVEADRGADAADEAMQGASALQRLKLEKRLAFLGTLGNNAPFIGLLGTVIGIVAAFDELSKVKMAAASGSTQLAPEAVMGRISEALVATAIGILIAIPAVAAYNAFQRVVRGTVANTDALSHMLLSYLKATPVAGSPERAAAHGSSSVPEQRADDGSRGN
jgi:biopolymer transport protein ExbB/TolQ